MNHADHADPRAPPPSPQREGRNGGARTREDAIAESVLAACRRVDGGCRIVGFSKLSAGTHEVRVRASSQSSVHTLQLELQRLMPLSKSKVHESFLDGSLEASILVLDRATERRVARRIASARPFARFVRACAWSCLLLGAGAWIATLAAPAGAAGVGVGANANANGVGADEL